MGALIRYALEKFVVMTAVMTLLIWHESFHLLSEHHPFRSISQHDASKGSP